MYTKYRQFIYQNKSKFDLNYDENSIIQIEIDLSQSCAKNKKLIEASFPKTRKPGIWIIRDSDKTIKRGSIQETYEVLSTSNIMLEMIQDLQFIYLGIRDIKKDIYSSFKQNVYRRYKYQQIYKAVKEKTKRNHAPTLIFEQIIEEPDRKVRESTELKIAIYREAVWWSCNPKQSRYIKKILGVGEEQFKPAIPVATTQAKKVYRKRRKKLYNKKKATT